MQRINHFKKIKDKGTIVMATSPDYPPYEFEVNHDGKDHIVGMDVDIMKKSRQGSRRQIGDQEHVV